ncbi:MAG: hypothetical protein NTW85_09315 [Methylococcales bacterium]|nr:hypothetical protein [Methylococcales bacterium]
MSITDNILWFNTEFHQKIEIAIKNTPFTLDMLAAIAYQETGYIWGNLRKKGLSTKEILELCVGDTIDEPNRSAFPKNKSELLKATKGDAMFAIARQGLEDMAEKTGIKAYRDVVKNHPEKFCHGFGIFQYDLQFFKNTPDYFLNKDYANFDKCLEKCLEELTRGLKKVGLQNKTKLTDLEIASIAIAYNTGGYKPAKGLKQGYFDGKNYYGELFFDYLRLAHTVATPSASPLLPPASAGSAVIAAPTPITAQGTLFEVDVQMSPLMLRSEPKIDANNKNVKARLPDGHIVQAVTNQDVNGFLEVETNLLGAHFHGYVAKQYLKPATGVTNVPFISPAPTPPTSGIVAVYIPRKEGTVTKRTETANAHSLNEQGQPQRKGNTPEELRSELATIIDWLAVENPAHLRYQPRNGSTFCNIYAHDYCYLAGVYLPRVWWSQTALIDLAQGKEVQPLYGKTIDELRANDLFRWLRDFGLNFGWRQTGTLTKLQTEVNQGALGIIVARRVLEGKSGHIVAVVPETNAQTAKRNSAGEVISPLQSQAGSTNFRYGTKQDWWKGSQFAESAFWLHT